MVRVGQVEGAVIAAVLVGNMVHGGDHVVHRHEIEAAHVDGDQRKPGRQRLAQFRQGGEAVVGAIGLVDFASFGVADHRSRAVDAPGNGALLANHLFRVVFGAEVRMVEFAGLLEHTFAKRAFVLAAHRDGTGMLEASGLQVLGAFHRIAGALYIGDLLALR